MPGVGDYGPGYTYQPPPSVPTGGDLGMYGSQSPYPDTPPPPSSSTYGAPNTGGEGNPWYTGYGGTEGGVGGGSMTGPPGQPFPWGGLAQAYGMGDQAIQQGLGMLQGGMNPAYLQIAMQRFQDPYGVDPEVLQSMRRIATETEAGSRENALLRSRQRSNATGFGNSASANAAEDQIRTESAANLNDTLARIMMMDDERRGQREGLYGGLLGQGYGTQAGLRAAYANTQSNRQFPIFPQNSPYNPYGAPQGPSGSQIPTGGWWSQGGKYMSGSQPNDPFYQPPQQGTGGQGYSPQNPWQPW